MFELQGHRGARGSIPENTLPSFEFALDHGVSAIETDLHLSRDDQPVIWQDAHLSEKLCRIGASGAARELSSRPLIRSLTVAQLRHYIADRNPDAIRFPAQEPTVTPAAERFARENKFHPFAIPTLQDFIAFVAAYAGDLGREVGKTNQQREKARNARLDLEIKRVPFHPEWLSDPLRLDAAGKLEQRVIDIIRKANVAERTTIRGFDHRAVSVVRGMETRVTGAVLIAGTAPVSPAQMAHAAGATLYCPEFAFVDEAIVRAAHDAALRVIPWTANRPEEWERLIAMGVDGITTDFPKELAAFLRARQIEF
jgi:glycerophosphoryl diester phosphodiesterase